MFPLAVVILAQSLYIVSSKAIFTGVDHSDLNASGEDIYLDPKNHAIAASSAIHNISEATDFRPKGYGLTIENDRLHDFLFSLSSFETFEYVDTDQRDLELTGGRDQLKEAIAAVYAPLPGSINADVAASMLVSDSSVCGQGFLRILDPSFDPSSWWGR